MFISMFWGYFSHFLCFGGVSILFLGVKCVLGIFCLSKGILVIYRTYKGILVLFKQSRVFWLVLDTRGTSVIFDVLGGAWVIFDILRVFQSFIRFWEHIGLFLGIKGVFAIFRCFGEYFGLFLGLGEYWSFDKC